MILHLSPTCPSHLGALGRMSLHLSSTWLPHLSFSLGVLGRMIFRLVSHLSPTLVSHTCLPRLSPTLGALGRMSLHLSSTCLPHLSLTLGVLGRMILHLSPTCSPNRFTCMGSLLLSKGCIPGPHDFASVSGLASHSGCLGPHEFTPVFHLSFTLVCHSGCLGPHKFTVYTCLPHSSPTLAFHTCLALWVPWAA